MRAITYTTGAIMGGALTNVWGIALRLGEPALYITAAVLTSLFFFVTYLHATADIKEAARDGRTL